MYKVIVPVMNITDGIADFVICSGNCSNSCLERGLFRNYYRQKQLAAGIEFLQKRLLPTM